MSGPFVSQPPFTISGLTRLGVKPILFGSSWRGFASTHPLMLPSTSKDALFACPLLLGACFSSLWNPPSPLHAPIMIPLFLTKVRLSLTFTLSHLFRFVPFLFGKSGSGVFANCSMALRSPFPFRQAQYVLVFPLKPAPFWKLFAGPGSTNTCFFRLSFYLNLWQELTSLSCCIRLQWVPGHLFLLGNDAADELAQTGRAIRALCNPL